ncbi:MAG: type II toxin-antitoxin system VapC family toxin [Actinobacteria bacterium]|nr:type II toxin-antitoxin system VapC family toxin [Actinomycetota bacterium]
MSGMRDDAVLIDSSILIYALGDPDPRREPCRRYLQAVTAGKGRAYASVEMLQETLHHRIRRTGDPRVAAAEVRDVLSTLIVLDFDREVLDRAIDLIEHTPVRGRDAVHAATAIAYGIGAIASTDAAFDRIPGLTRIDPIARPAA